MPEVDQDGLTIGEIAEQVQGLTASPLKLTERLRHLGKIGFLIPAGNVGEGTGKHRLYAPDAAYDAALMVVFAEIGQHPGQQGWLGAAVENARDLLADWKKARAKGPTKPLILKIEWKGGGNVIEHSWMKKTKTKPPKGSRAAEILAASSVVTVAVDLGVLFEHVWKAQLR